MSLAKNKRELLEQSHLDYNKLFHFVDLTSKQELDDEFPVRYLNRNLRDVLAHLHHWHLMALDWYKSGLAGKKPDIPSKGYTWNTLPELNHKIRENYKNVDYSVVRSSIDQSFEALQKVIEQHTDEELFENGHYEWTGTTTLGAYLTLVTSTHYEWALQLIKRCRTEMISLDPR